MHGYICVCVCECMYICMCICMHYVCIYIYIFMGMCMYVLCMYIYMYAWACVCICVYVCIMYVCMSMCMYMYVCMHVCMYACICVCVFLPKRTGKHKYETACWVLMLWKFKDKHTLLYLWIIYRVEDWWIYETADISKQITLSPHKCYTFSTTDMNMEIQNKPCNYKKMQ